MDAYNPNRLGEYNETQRKRAEYIERGEKKIQELFEDTIEEGVVKGIVLEGGGNYSRKQIDGLTDLAKEHGAGVIKNVRGRGLFIAFDVEDDKTPVETFSQGMAA